MTMRQLKTFSRAFLLVVMAICVGAQAASADLEFDNFGVSLVASDGGPSLTAGAHPDLTTTFAFKRGLVDSTFGPQEGPIEDVRTLNVDLPPGLVGNPAV